MSKSKVSKPIALDYSVYHQNPFRVLTKLQQPESIIPTDNQAVIIDEPDKGTTETVLYYSEQVGAVSSRFEQQTRVN